MSQVQVIGSKDPNTLLLLNFNGTDGDTTTTDRSRYRRTVTFNGAAAIEADQAKFGATSLYNPGASGDYLSVPHADELDFGGNDFTVEFWMYAPNATGALGGYWYKGTSLGSPTTNDLMIFSYSNQVMSMRLWGHFIGDMATQYSLNTWHHMAFERSGNTWRCYMDGVVESSTTSSQSVRATSEAGQIMRGFAPFATGAEFYPRVYIDDFRISNIARYNGAFTPPSSEFKR